MRNNTSGITGFIFSILAVLCGWVPYVGGICWVLGAILSSVGLSNRPNGLAWAGFAISFLWILTYITVGLMFDTIVSFTLWPYYLW